MKTGIFFARRLDRANQIEIAREISLRAHVKIHPGQACGSTPSREPDNPAAGSARGSGYDVQAYFKKCVANGGRAPDEDTRRPK
jgi:hypothetical protein